MPTINNATEKKTVSFRDIVKANSTIKFGDFKGRKYAEVPQRVKVFRILYPQGFILTDMISNEDGTCIFRASAGYYDENGNRIVLGTGTAYEREGSTYINKTSYIENCETSAVGRALGFLHIGSEETIASLEEVVNAVTQQEAAKKAEEPTFYCEECRRRINPYTTGNGEIVMPSAQVKMTAGLFGKKLCNLCANKK